MSLLTTGHMCCGAGGDILGAIEAGASPQWAFDLNAAATKTAYANFPQVPVRECDIRLIHEGDYRKVDLLICGIPCQPFTRLGRRLKENDERDISESVADAILKIDPESILFENVSEYRLSRGFEVLNSRLSAYKIHWQMLHFADYGIPQTRKRLIGLASKKRLLDFPTATHSAEHSLFDQRKPWRTFAEIRDGEGLRPISSNLLKGKIQRLRRYAEKGFGFSWQIIDDNDMMPTILATFHSGSCSKSNAVSIYEKGFLRNVSFTEARRAQGFPDDYIFVGTKKEKWQMVANAFPPAVVKNIVERIINHV